MSPVLVEVLEIALQQSGDIEVVGTTLFAEAAFHAVIHLLHLLVKLFSEIHAVGGATQKEIHTVAALYLNTCSARLAVTTATTEVATQLLTVFLNAGAHLVVKHRRIFLE